MRSLVFALLPAIVALPACAERNSGYEPDPDDSLGELLAPGVTDARPLTAAERERLRFDVGRLAIRHPGHVPSQVAASALAFESGEARLESAQSRSK